MDQTNAILRYLKRKHPEKDEENVASGSGLSSNNNNSQKDGKIEGQLDMHDKNVRDGPIEG